MPRQVDGWRKMRACRRRAVSQFGVTGGEGTTGAKLQVVGGGSGVREQPGVANRCARHRSSAFWQERCFLQDLGACNPAVGHDALHGFVSHFKALNVKSAEESLLREIDRHVDSVNRSIGRRSSTAMSPPKQPPSSMLPDGIVASLLPKSKWVYETPDKQRMKKMEELKFDAPREVVPAVIAEHGLSKTIYGVAENVYRHVRLEDVDPGQRVPIDLNYLKPLCAVPIVPGEANVFLRQNEETVDISPDVSYEHDSSRKRRHDNENLNWYEQHMKMLATCRPAKMVKKGERWTKKSLSFEDTPTSARRRTRFNSCGAAGPSEVRLDESGGECSLLEMEFYESTSTSVMPDDSFNLLPPPKWYPSKMD